VLKIPHHGGDEPLLAELLAQTRPRYAVITSSDDEPEDPATLDALADAGVDAFLTRLGAVVIRSDGKTVTAEYENAR
jgi:beta-lactamase superfamily II metal-dependent hydrolase